MNHSSLSVLPALALCAHVAPLAAQQTQPSIQAGAEISLHAGRSQLLVLPSVIDTVAVADPNVVDVKPLSPTQVLVLAKSFGATDVLVSLKDGTTVVHPARVRPDCEALQAKLRRMFGDDLTVEDMGGTVAVSGSVASVEVGDAMGKFMAESGVKWADLTKLAGVQQVQLRVRIAEASRTALRSLGVSAVASSGSGFGGMQSPGSVFQPVSITPTPGTTIANPIYTYTGVGGAVTSATTLFGGLPSANLEVFLQALVENRYVRLLAEPNLVAISGAEASFLVGGEFPIPIIQGSTAGASAVVTIQYKEFGVRLNFRPLVLGEGRIRLDVAPEVSELSELGSLQQNGFVIPGIVTRRSSTTVELGSGQSFAMAGLLRNKEQSRRGMVPILGDLPILGTLFRSVRYEREETELVVIVTAELVEPVDGDGIPLPGEEHVTPSDWELFFGGMMAGSASTSDPEARMQELGLGGLQGPGAWQRSDDPKQGAADELPQPTVEGEDPSEAPAAEEGAAGEEGPGEQGSGEQGSGEGGAGQAGAEELR